MAFASLSLFHGPGRSEPLAATRIAAVLVPYKMVRPNGVGKGMGGPVSFGAEIHPACTANSPGARKSSRNRRPCAVEADSSSIYANGTNNAKAIQTGCLSVRNRRPRLGHFDCVPHYTLQLAPYRAFGLAPEYAGPLCNLHGCGSDWKPRQMEVVSRCTSQASVATHGAAAIRAVRRPDAGFGLRSLEDVLIPGSAATHRRESHGETNAKNCSTQTTARLEMGLVERPIERTG